MRAIGPMHSPILIVGDVPTYEDVQKGQPFTGATGSELTKMLHEAGILFSECRVMNVVDTYQPGGVDDIFQPKKKIIAPCITSGFERVKAEIELNSPNVIITLGALPFWCFTGEAAIKTWRGSELSFQSRQLLPTLHPSQVFTMWNWRVLVVRDLMRAQQMSLRKEPFSPPYTFTIRPTADQCLSFLGEVKEQLKLGKVKLGVDIETRSGHIACVGIAVSKLKAICIPFMCIERPIGYFSEAEELIIIKNIREVLTHPNAQCVGQNFSYDDQHFAKHWGFLPNITDDTMLQQHVLFAGQEKGLDFLASMYAEHYTYWKGEGKNWNPNIPEEQLWVYNCKDSCYTLEIQQIIESGIINKQLSPVYDFQMELRKAVVRMMFRGVRINQKLAAKLAEELLMQIQSREERIKILLGHEINIRSPKQMQTLFYTDLKLPIQKHKKTWQPTVDSQALETLSAHEPLVSRLCHMIQDLRSLNIFLTNFIQAPLDEDGRIRCYFNVAGTETYRFSSSENAFDKGTNLQNIPSGDEDEEHEDGELVLPNIRKLFIPDPNYIIWEADLAGADAQVVAWEAEDDDLKAAFRAGIKIHAHNAKMIYGGDAGPDGKRMPYYKKAKMGVHLTNYGGKPRTLSKSLGMLMHEAELFQRRWFQMHPNILEWHRRIENQLRTTRQVENKFGYRRFYYDRIDGLLPEALAWIPQSTVACVINRALVNIDKNLPKVQLLLQVHDSLVGQVLRSEWAQQKILMRPAMLITVPYPDPLIIKTSLKASPASWGDAVEEGWE